MSEFESNINWYPGHMEKAKRQIQEQLKLVDVVIEIRDARLPISSSNPMLKEIIQNKRSIIVLNKADLAVDEISNKFVNNLESCILLDSLKDNVNKIISDKVKELCIDKIERAKRRGIRNKAIRVMVIGIPNVGKSTFINSFSKKKVAKVENRPGVTRQLSWIRINNEIELLDTPGVLWPKLQDQQAAIKLAIIGTINDNILDKELIVNYCLLYLKNNYPGKLNERYGIDEDKDNLFEQIAINKSWLIDNNEIDKEKTRNQILKDVRNNKLGRISWELFEDA